MLTTIVQPDFAQKIISRYTSGAQSNLSGVELLLIQERKENEAERSLVRSIQNVYLIQRAITENTVLNLNIHLNFLHNIFNKTVRELYESTARHIGMMEKRVGQMAQVPPAGKILRPGQMSSPYQFRPDSMNPPTVLEARQNRVDTLPLILDRKLEAARITETLSKLKRANYAHDGTKSAQTAQSDAQAKRAEKTEQNARSVTASLKWEPLPETMLNMPSWIRELWRIEPSTTALGGKNVVLIFPQEWRRDIETGQKSEQAWAAWTSLTLNGNMPIFPHRQIPLRDNANETRSNAFLPKLPRLSHIMPVGAADTERTETPHVMSQIHLDAVQTNARQKEEKAKESNQMQRPRSGFHAASDMILKHQPDMEHVSRTPQSSMENPHAAESFKWFQQKSDRGKAAPVAHRTAESASTPSSSAVRVSWSNTQNASESRSAEADMLQKIWSYSSVPRQESKHGFNGTPFTGVHAPLFHRDTPTTDRRSVFKAAEHASIRKSSGISHKIQVPASSHTESSPVRSIMGGMRNIPQYKSILASNDMSLIPASQETVEAHAPFYAAQLGVFKQSETAASLTQPLIFRADPAKTEALPATLASGAMIVYRKESPARREPPPTPLSVSQDIEFIKKTVKQSNTSVQPQKANIAVNLPASAASGFQKQEADIIRDIERQAAVIADKVYNSLERRLRSEQMRKGLL